MAFRCTSRCVEQIRIGFYRANLPWGASCPPFRVAGESLRPSNPNTDRAGYRELNNPRLVESVGLAGRSFPARRRR